MKNYISEIENKLKKNLELEELKIIDNTQKHIGHKFFSENKVHIKLVIKSKFLTEMPRLHAQKKILTILKEDLKDKIHAIEIKFVQ